MTALTVTRGEALAAFDAQLTVAADAVRRLDPSDLLAATRCRGWLVLDLLTHLRLGLEEMLRGCTAPIAQEPTCDAATYWQAQAPGNEARTTQGVADTLYLRRVASAYREPFSAVHHLLDAVDAVRVASRGLAPGSLRFQGYVLTAGDFLATWAVELVIHHVDLGLELSLPEIDPGAMRLTRATLDALGGSPLPATWDDETAVLVATGRRAPTTVEAADLHEIGVRVPVLG